MVGQAALYLRIVVPRYPYASAMPGLQNTVVGSLSS